MAVDHITIVRRGEVWMLVRDYRVLNCKMEEAGLSVRQLATIAGWKSHSYLARILRGEVRTLRTDPALRIAHALRVPVDDLFVTRVTTNSGQGDKRRRVA